MRNISDTFVEKIRTHVVYSITCFRKKCYEIVRKNMVELGRPQMTIWRMSIGCWYLRVKIHTQNM